MASICGRPLSGKGKRWGRCCAWSDAVICPAFECGRTTAAGLYGSSRTGSKSPTACSKHSGKPWLSQPRLADCCAILSFRSPSRPRDRGRPTPPRPEFYRCHVGVAAEPLLVFSDGAPVMIRALKEYRPRTQHESCLAHKVCNLQSKVPEDPWPDFQVRAVRLLPSGLTGASVKDTHSFSSCWIPAA